MFCPRVSRPLIQILQITFLSFKYFGCHLWNWFEDKEGGIVNCTNKMWSRCQHRKFFSQQSVQNKWSCYHFPSWSTDLYFWYLFMYSYLLIYVFPQLWTLAEKMLTLNSYTVLCDTKILVYEIRQTPFVNFLSHKIHFF